VQALAVCALNPLIIFADQRPGSDQAHLAAHDIPELWKLVQGGAAQETAYGRDSRIVLDLEQPLRLVAIASRS
jgi:hypothetical protein